MLNFTNKSFSNNPFPYVEFKNVFNEDLLEKIVNKWPKEKYFKNEIPGVKLFSLLDNNNFLYPDEDNDFWKDILFKYVPSIKNQLNRVFYPYIYSKYKKIFPKLSIYQLDLMTSTENFEIHGMHTHHYHSPNYTYTMLFYLEEGRNNCLGTDLYGPKDTRCKYDEELFTKLVEKNLLGSDGIKQNGYNLDVINARMYPEYEMEIKKSCNFEKNKLMAFLDSPISYHGVGKERDIKNFDKIKQDYHFGQRKILRMHVGVNEKYIEKFYGLKKEDYFQERRERKLSRKIFNKIKYEIKLLQNSRKYSIYSIIYFFYNTNKDKLLFKLFFNLRSFIKNIKWLRK